MMHYPAYEPPTEAELAEYMRETGLTREAALNEHRISFFDPELDAALPLEPLFDAEAFNRCEAFAPGARVPCFGAVDLAARRDLTAGCLVWNMGDGVFFANVTIWTPADGLEARATSDQAPYGEWSRAGHIQTVPGAVMTYEPVARWIADAAASYNLIGVAYDPWRIDDLVRELGELGLSTCNAETAPGTGDIAIVAHPQGFVRKSKTGLHMPTSLDTTERLLYGQKLRVKRNPALRSAVLGVTIIADASGNRRMTKSKSTTRIDAAVALVMAVGYATLGGGVPFTVDVV